MKTKGRFGVERCVHHFSHCFRACVLYGTTTPISEFCKGLYHHKIGSDTSHHVLRFTGFDHRRERRRLEYAFLTNAAATVRSVWERCE